MKSIVRLLLILISVGLVSQDVFAQRRGGSRRGSVRYATPNGNYSRNTQRGGRVDYSKNTSGNTRSESATLTGRGGESVSGSRNVSRDGDTLTVDKQAQSSRGGSRESSKEIEFDDGRVDSVERESKTTGRYGESAERSGSAEREGYRSFEFEGEAKTSTGREADVEGVAARGAYGRGGVVADVDTKYYGDRTVAAARGPYGAAVRGPYYGAAVRTLPAGYRGVTYYGRSYYYYGSYYYRPYAWRGATYYWVMAPPYGVVYTTVPAGAVVITVGAATYYYAGHTCYVASSSGGSVSYEVVPAPEGLKTTSLPPDAATVTAGGNTYYYYKNTFYRKVDQSGQVSYVVVTMPQGVVALDALPPEFEIIETEGGGAFFSYQGKYYMPYLDPSGKERYIIVDPPRPPAPKTPQNMSASANASYSSLTVPSGTALPIRFTEGMSSETAKEGQRFSGFLDTELKVGDVIAAPRGSKVYGIIVEAEKAGSMSGQAKLILTLTDIDINGRVLPIVSNKFKVEGASSSKDTGKKIAGGAGLGAAIGAIADGGSGAWKGAVIGAGVGTAASAATKGQQVAVEPQALLPFTLDQPLTVPVAVPTTTAE
jgi:hypothetical protein